MGLQGECRKLNDIPMTDSVIDDAVRSQLALILAAPQFVKSKQLKLLLEFLVNETLDGRNAKLKEYSIALAVFGRDASFDPTADNIVRVEARRLRTKLEEYYESVGWL